MRRLPPAAIVLAGLLGVGLVLPVSADAWQTAGSITGAIAGRVTDSSGALLPQVSVTIFSASLIGNGGTRTATTNGEGAYRFPALPPGTYTIVFRRDGFAPLERQRVSIGVGQTATIDAELGLASVTGSVSVSPGSISIDRQSTGLGAHFDARQLGALPNSRSMFAILSATAAVQVTRFEVGGSTGESNSPYSAYGTARSNRPTVEGINVAGISGTGFTLDYGSFAEVSVMTANHGPEWSAPGVHMQFVTKSGGNVYHGSVYADYENRRWQSFNIDDGQLARAAQAGAGDLRRDDNRVWSDRDVNADAGGFIRRDVLWWYGSLRRQDVSFRQVNFPVRPLPTELNDFTAKFTWQPARGHRLVAFAQAGRNHQPFRLDPFGPAGGSLSAATAINQSEASTANQLAWGGIWKAEWNGIFKDRVYVETRTGEFRTERSERPNGGGPRFEDIATQSVRGANRDWQRTLARQDVFGSVSYFTDRWLGTHHFKAGGELLRNSETEVWRRAYSDDVVHVLIDGTPAEVYLFETPSRSSSLLWTAAAYVSESWRPSERLTLNVGLRFDRYRASLQAQSHPAGRFNPTELRFPALHDLMDWNVAAPRVSAVYALSGNGSTILKLTYSRYWFGAGTDLGFDANPNSNVWWKRYSWTDPNGSGRWEPGEEEGEPKDSRGGVALESLDPRLDLPFMREASAGIERELFHRLELRTGVVWRGEWQHYIRQNASRPFSAFTVPVALADPGPDGVAGTSDDGAAIQAYDVPREVARLPPSNVVRNVPDAGSRYWTWDVSVVRRFAGRWSLTGSVAHVWNGDQANGYFGQSVRQNVYPLTPNDLINTARHGQYAFRTWSANAAATLEARWGLQVTPLLRHQSGQPFGRTFSTTLNYGTVRILAEPIDSRRMDGVTLLDVRIEKSFHASAEHRVAAFVDVFNLLNGNSEQNTNWSSGPAFLEPLSIVPPRIARIGMKLAW